MAAVDGGIALLCALIAKGQWPVAKQDPGSETAVWVEVYVACTESVPPQFYAFQVPSSITRRTVQAGEGVSCGPLLMEATT